MVLGKLESCCVALRMKVERYLIQYTKINSKWIKDLNIRSDTIKLPEENIGRTLFDINHSNILFDPPPRIITIQTQKNQWDLIKLKSFYTAKETIKKKKNKKKTKRQHIEWEKIFANDETEKGLISKIYKQQQQQKKPNCKWAEDLNRQFSKEDIWMAKGR